MIETIQPEQLEVYKALFKAQEEIQNPLKNKENPFHKSRYADLAAYLDSTKGPLRKYDLFFTHTTFVREGLIICKTSLNHMSGQSIFTELPLGSATGIGMQAMGAAITYAKRYNISDICNICADEDDDAEAFEKENRKKKQESIPEKKADKNDVPKVDKSQADELRRLIVLLPEETRKNFKKTLANMGFHQAEDVTKDKFGHLVKSLNNSINNYNKV